MSSMKPRLIWSKGQPVGDEPVGFYVYLYRHGEIARYVGKGGGGRGDRWDHHLTPRANDSNQVKHRYFCEHLMELQCLILADRLPEARAFEIEDAVQVEHGFWPTRMAVWGWVNETNRRAPAKVAKDYRNRAA